MEENSNVKKIMLMRELKGVFNPKVSIVIPVFNGSDFLSQAIESALAQTYCNFEVLVVNDGSDDSEETEHIALSYGDSIRYYRKANGGVASALNLAIENMSGEYFSWLSHDDLYVSNKVERQIEVLSSMPPEYLHRTIIYSDYSVFTNNPDKSIPMMMNGVAPEEFRYWLTIKNVLHGCTLLIPKAAFQEIGKFNETLRTTQDYDLWFRMAKKYLFVHMPECLVKARCHPEQGSIKMSRVAKGECNTLLSDFVADLTPDELLHASRQKTAVAYAQIAASMWYRGFSRAGCSATLLSFKHFPHSSFSANTSAFKIITKSLAMYYMIKPFRKFIPPHLRLLIRKWLEYKKTQSLTSPEFLRNMELKEKFSKIYEENIFRGRASRSGEGADLEQTRIIRQEIPKLIRKFGIKTFLDAPCGDWYWMKEVELSVGQYIGVDIVEDIIAKNQYTFGTSQISFQCLNLTEDELPKSDLIFSRDCLVHLSFSDALKILANFKRSGAKYLLTTTFTDRAENEDLGDGFWRPLNKQRPPFNFPEPICLINEGCTECDNLYVDKSLGLWLLQDINLP
ncbi:MULTISPECIES: glycosyltransferase [Methylomonas]|uniref:glycosyltransferase n=1 Tax=Methylomonas TaxID=416 RepID=UPI001042E290|nr:MULTISPECIES: glycosyltransferase [Methylomonas]